MPIADREEALEGFLLGTLPDAEHDALEERLLADGDLQDRLDLARDDLIHAYLAGSLAPPERDAFEKHFLLAARHRERLGFLQDLVTATARVAARAVPPRRPWASRAVWWPVAAAVLIGVAVMAAVLTRRHDGPAARTAHDPSPSPPASVAAPEPSPSGGRRGVAVVRVRPGPRAVTDLPIGADTGTVRLLVAVEPAPSYDVVLSGAGGREAWRSEGLTLPARGEPLAVSVPADLFAETEYVLTVQAEALRSAPPVTVVRRLRVARAGR